MTTQNRWPGVPLALASAVLFGASTPSAKLLLAHEDPEAALSRKSTELETLMIVALTVVASLPI